MATKKTKKIKKELQLNVSPAMLLAVNQLIFQLLFKGIGFDLSFISRNPDYLENPDYLDKPDKFYFVCIIHTNVNREFYVYKDGKVLPF